MEAKNTLVAVTHPLPVIAHDNEMMFPAVLSHEQIHDIANWLCRMEETRMWYWGDFFLYLEQQKGTHNGKGTTDEDRRRWREMRDAIVEKCGMHWDSIRVGKRVCAFYNGGISRKPGLTFTHHRVVMDELGFLEDIRERKAAADKYLERCRDEELTVSQVRQYIREENGRAHKPETIDPWHQIYSFRTKLKKINVSELSDDRKANLADSLKPFVQLYNQLTSMDVESVPPVKESIR